MRWLSDSLGLGNAPAPGAAGRALASRWCARNDRTIGCVVVRPDSTRGRVEPQPGAAVLPKLTPEGRPYNFLSIRRFYGLIYIPALIEEQAVR